MKVAFLLFMFACSSLPQKLDTSVLYRRDMQLKVGSLEGDGFLVVPDLSSYKMEVIAQGDLDLFSYSSCAREEYQEEAWQKGWFKNKKKVQLEYRPNAKLEKHNCDLQFQGYEKEKGRHSWGYIVKEEPSYYALSANVICQGIEKRYSGVSQCQTRAGIFMQIEFDRPVKWDSNCKVDASVKDDAVFTFTVPRDYCSFGFLDRDGKRHRLLSFGYDQIPMRGE